MPDERARDVKIGRRLRSERRRLGIGQAEAAAIGGVGRTAQYRYETDERVPDAEYLRKLHDAGMDLVYIITGGRSTAQGKGSHAAIDSELVGNLIQVVDELFEDESDRTQRITKRVALAQFIWVVLQSRLEEPLSLQHLREIAADVVAGHRFPPRK